MTMRTACLLLAIAAASPVDAQSPQSRCADCHFARPDAPGGRHLSEWDRSAHGRNGVGCETCHGGDATTFDPVRAHQGVLHLTNPASPVNRVNLPATCGRCHTGPYLAFRKSRHYELVRGGNRDAPTCATCHGEVAAYLLSPRRLESQCASCHGPGRVAPNADFPPEGRLMLEGIRELRAQVKEADAVIRRVKDKTRRERLEDLSAQAAVPLVQATEDGHAFVFDELAERLALARQRVAELYEQLANPAPR
jgi:Cytochrome c7 and related cytochrome c/Cytochrome c554 and c-prime